MSDDGHVFGTVAGSAAGLIVVECYIENPVELVFDGPVTTYGTGSFIGVEVAT